MDAYINELLNQFKAARNIKNIDLNSPSFKEEFNRWLTRREEIQYNYLDLLEYMECNVFHNENVAEVGKGKFDTVTQYGDTLLISPYVDGVQGNNSKVKAEVTTSNLLSYGCLSNYIDCFLLQNAYNEKQINALINLSNKYFVNVIIGVYGFIDDKDRDYKMNALRELSYKLSHVPIEEDFTDSDYGYYCYAVATEIFNKNNELKEFGKSLIKTPKQFIS